MGEEMEEFIIGENRSRMVFCDNLDTEYGVPALADESVALTFTSPPYYNYIRYHGKGVGTEESYHDYLVSIGTVIELLQRKTMPGGRLVINVTNMHSRQDVEQGESFVYPIVGDVICIAKMARFIFFDEIIWIKGDANAGALGGSFLFGSYPYPPTPKILNTIFEHILVFKKAGKREVDKAIKEQSKIERLEWRKWTKGIWEIPHDRDSGHPASFPFAVAERIVRLYSFVEDVVLDPFAGSGTTVVAAEKNQRKGIGFEIAEQYKQAVLDKAAKWVDQLSFI